MRKRLTVVDRFHRCRDLILAANDEILLDNPLYAFMGQDDSHLPQRLINRSVRDLLATDVHELCRTPYFGQRKLERFLDILEKVADRATRRVRETPNTIERPLAVAKSSQPAETSDLTDAKWNQWCETLRAAGLEYQPLGRFAASLIDLPRGLWHVELREFTSRSLDAVSEMPGYGPAKLSVVHAAVGSLAGAVASFAASPHLRPRACSRHIHNAASWIEHILQLRTIPTVDDVRRSFLTPLFMQLDTDLGSELTGLIRRRVGMDGPPETLDEIASDRGLTRERIRQLTSRAPAVMAVRWPEGKHLLDDFYELLLSDNSSTEQVQIVSTALDELFDVADTRGTSRSDVMAMWERAGRMHRTPMSQEEVLHWAGECVPKLSPELVAQWIVHDAPSCEDQVGRPLYFSHDPDDLLLRQVYAARQPVAVYDLADCADSDERNLRCRLDRDPRFIEDEYKRVHASELLSVHRDEGRWSVGLVAAPGHDEPRRPAIPLDCLISIIVSGLTQLGVADATVWGVHRFTSEVLARLFGAQLPGHITPFILAGLLVRHADGAVRTMRRRRLRWDCADESLPVRGKSGWIDYVVTNANVPMTIDELDAALRQHYQDYERYVLTQLSADGDEDGRGLMETAIIPGSGARIPVIFVSRQWRLNDAADNVSEGIRLFGTRIIAGSGKQSFARQELERMSWMIRWCERNAYGQMQWGEDRRSESDLDVGAGTTAELENHHSQNEVTHVDPIASTGETVSSSDEIERILSRVL